MKIVQVDEKQVEGLCVRTTNADEMSPETSRIGNLWQNFYEKIIPNLAGDAIVYGVYYDYESDADGEFSVLAGADKLEKSLEENIKEVSIKNGSYMVFEAKGDMPQVVIDTWLKIWDYFSAENAQHRRAYTTDFELYKSQDEIEIYIAIK